MSLIKLLVVWTPEAVLNLIIVLLIAGLKDKLKLKRNGNLIRFLTAVACMVLSSVFILPLIPYFNIVINFLIHIIIYTAIILCVYRVSLYKAFISVLLMGFTFASFENVIYPFLIAYISGGFENYNNNIIQYILFSCFTRIAQASLIAFLWNSEYILLVTELNKKIHNVFYAIIVTLTISELYMSSVFYDYFSLMSLENRILFGIVLTVIVVAFYIIIYKIIFSSIRLLIKQGYRQYQMLEQGAEEAFRSVYSLLEGNDIDSAKNYISILIEGDKNTNK